jgi:hypothetical protein
MQTDEVFIMNIITLVILRFQITGFSMLVDDLGHTGMLLGCCIQMGSL